MRDALLGRLSCRDNSQPSPGLCLATHPSLYVEHMMSIVALLLLYCIIFGRILATCCSVAQIKAFAARFEIPAFKTGSNTLTKRLMFSIKISTDVLLKV